MCYQVSLSPSARRDLRDIVRYISLDSPERAVQFGQFLVHHTKRLAEFPEMGRVVPEFGNPSIREIVVRSYRVIYQVDHRDGEWMLPSSGTVSVELLNVKASDNPRQMQCSFPYLPSRGIRAICFSEIK